MIYYSAFWSLNDKVDKNKVDFNFTASLDIAKRKLKKKLKKRSSADSTDSEADGHDRRGISKSQARVMLEKSMSLSTILEDSSSSSKGQTLIHHAETDHDEVIQPHSSRAKSSGSDSIVHGSKASASDGISSRHSQSKSQDSSTGDNSDRRTIDRHPDNSSRGGKKITLKADMQNLRLGVTDHDDLRLMDYLDASNELMFLTLCEKIDGVRRGGQYDLEKQMESVKRHVLVQSSAGHNDLPNPKKNFDCTFPIDTLENFLLFEKSLDPKADANIESPEKLQQRQTSLVRFLPIKLICQVN